MASSLWGFTGWDTTGKVEKTEHDGSKAVTLAKDSVLSQNVYGRLGKRDKIHVKFWAASEERCSEGHLPDR